VDSFWTHQLLYRIAFAESDASAIQRELDWSKGKPQESTLTYYEAKATLSRGSLAGPESFLRPHARSLKRRGLESKQSLFSTDKHSSKPI